MSHNSTSIKYSRYENITNKPRLQKIDLKVHKEKKNSSIVTVIKAAISILLFVVLAQITMQSYMAQMSYTMHEKQIKLTKMREETQLLQTQVDELNSPKKIHDAAKKQSLVPTDQVGYINLKEQTITGVKN